MAAPAFSGSETLTFGVFQLSLQTGELHKSGRKIGLRPQAAKVLILLATQAGELVTREELKDRIWGSDTFVDFEHGLNLCIRQIRAALDDDANTPRYVETLPRRGYRFIAPVKSDEHALGPKPTIPNASKAPQAPVQTIDLPPQKIAGRYRSWVWLSAACLVILVVAAGVYILRVAGRTHPRPPAGKIMFAVLPFENISGDPAQDYFSDGLTEEMISRLGQLDPQRLGVIARTSAIQYKGTKKRIDQIGRELGIDYVLEGTVRRAGDRVRVSAQLIQVSDQTHLWARNYERDLRDILSVQEDVAQTIADEVEIKLTPQQQARLASPASVNPAAYEAYLKGRYYLVRHKRHELGMALDYFQQAIHLDPNYALAYASLAETYNFMNTAYMAPLEAGPKAKAAVLKALELDESLPVAHAILGRVHLFYDWDWPGAEKELLRSLELNPNLPEGHLGYASYLSSIGRFDEALVQVRTASALDPLSTNARFEAVWATLHHSRRYAEMIEESHKIRDLPPDFTAPFGDEAFAYVRLGRVTEAVQAAKAASNSDTPTEVAQAAQVYAEAGNKQEARRLLRQLLDQRKNKFVCGNNIATVYSDLGEKDKAFYWLGEGIRQRSL